MLGVKNMAEMVTKQELENAKVDAKDWGEAVNENKIVTPRYGEPFKSGPFAVKEIEENGIAAVVALNAKADEVVAQGFYKGYATETALKASLLTVSEMRARADDTRKIWRWNRTSAEGVTPVTGTWTDTGSSDLDQAKGYADEKTTALKENFIIEQTGNGIFFLTLDRVPLFYVLNDGSFHLCGDSVDLRSHIANVPQTNSDSLLLEITDSENKIIAYLDKNLELFFVNNHLSLQAQTRKAQSDANLNLTLNAMLESEGRTVIAKKALSDTSKLIKNEIFIEPFGGATGQVQRIAAMLKLTNSKILYMWGGGVGSPYNGDGEGVKLYKRIVTYDNAGRILDKGTKVVFRETVLAAGIAKHPMLGRTATGRIVLIWDERNTVYSTTNAYSTMIAFSDDEGVTFTAPVQIPNNPAFTFQIVGSTGTIVTMPSGRLVCPMYYTLPFQTIGMMYSDDNGITWQYGTVLNISGGILQEPSISLDAANNIIVSSRHTLTNRRKHISKSTDGGATLISVGFNNDLEAPHVASSIFYDAKNGLMLHSSPTGLNRDKYRIQVSADNGVTWKVLYRPFLDDYYIGYTQIIKLSTDLYAVAIEGMDNTATVNSKENVGIFIFNIKEVLSNVYRN